MEIVTTQFGQNIADTNSSGTNVSDKGNNGVSQVPLNPEKNGSESTSERAGSGNQEAAKDTQGRQQSADNLQREEQQDLSLAVEEVQTFLQAQNRNLAFSVDEETQRSVVTVKDAESGDVIRQIPSEEVLELAQRIQELQEDVGASVGVFVNKQV